MMTKGEFQEAFRTAFTETLTCEISRCPEESHVFSEELNDRMTELIQREMNPFHKMANAWGKKAAVAFLAIIFFSGLIMTSPVIKAQTLTWMKVVFNNHKGNISDGGKKEIKEYSVTYVPEGFREKKICDDDGCIETIYADKTGHEISFIQIPEGASVVIDEKVKRMVKMATLEFEGKKINIYQLEKSWAFVWSEGGKDLMIRYDGGILYNKFSPEEVLKMIKSVSALQE